MVTALGVVEAAQQADPDVVGSAGSRLTPMDAAWDRPTATKALLRPQAGTV